IEAFIEAKREPGRLRMFNLSVLVTDAFMDAVKNDGPWDLTFNGTIFDSVSARDLWNKIMRATFAYAEPGVIFIDRINQRNNLHYCETIAATNPCGEQPLPPYGACLLGSINLSAFVEASFTPSAAIDMTALRETVATAVRLMDNVIDVSRFPLEEQRQEALAKRRIGLGVTGLADAFIQCGVRYGSPESLELAAGWFDCLRDAAYRASIDLAAEKGPFPLFDAGAYLAGETIRELDPAVQALIRQHGIRNALLTSIAPTGTISLLANNVSSGIEPVFAFSHDRRVLLPNGETTTETVENNAHRLYRLLKGDATPLTDAFVDAQSLSPREHLAVQALVQKYIDSSISKTINLPESIGFDAFQSIYFDAYDQGCKGCTTYRPSDIRGAVLSLSEPDPKKQPAVVPATIAAPADRQADENAVIYMTQPLDRPPALTGSTYKINWPESDHAIYITVNDITQDGRRRPFEVFINSKNMEHYAWTVALTRMISAVFRRGGDVVFVVEELKAVFDPRGGYWMRGHYVPSLLAAIGEVIENHMIETGFMDRVDGLGVSSDEGTEAAPMKRRAVAGAGRQCPRCGAAGLMKQEGCDTCASCGWSRCG
ncbi:MAG: adenosylcobalamin-dependent ribonucleoside-diphosphate reductase, partial [Alphaproteobacteria bacterium]